MKLTLEIGDVVEHRVGLANRNYAIGIIVGYKNLEGLYEVRWSDGETRKHTRELLKQIA